MTEVVVVEAVRSAVGKKNGTLRATHPADILGPVQMAAIERAGITSRDVDQVVGGCINQIGAQGMNITRTAWLSHGGDETTACSTVDSQCGSSQHAVGLAYSLIASGVEDVVLACGVENMSRLPIGADAAAVAPQLIDPAVRVARKMKPNDFIGFAVGDESVRAALEQHLLGVCERFQTGPLHQLVPRRFCRQTAHEIGFFMDPYFQGNDPAIVGEVTVRGIESDALFRYCVLCRRYRIKVRNQKQQHKRNCLFDVQPAIP